MGGFALEYAAPELTVVTGFGSAFATGVHFSWFNIDATRRLLVGWTDDVDILLAVVDHSGAVTVGSVVFTVPSGVLSSAQPTATQLTSSGDWMLLFSTGEVQRFSISGTTVAVGAFLDRTFPTGLGLTFNYGDPRVPAALFEGHDATVDGQINTAAPDGAQHRACLGLDIDHYLVPGGLSWFDGVGHVVSRWFVYDLSVGGPQLSFDPGALSGTFPSAFLGSQDGPGVGYWWMWDSPDGGQTLTNPLTLALIVASSSSLSVATVTGFDFDTVAELAGPFGTPGAGNLNVDDAGRWWIGPVTHTRPTSETNWTPTNMFPWAADLVAITTTTATVHSYVGESDFASGPRPLLEIWPFDTGMIVTDRGDSFLVADAHGRAEGGLTLLSSLNVCVTDSPHRGGSKVGLSAKRVAAIATDGLIPATVFLVVSDEVPLAPSLDFGVSLSTQQVGQPVTFYPEDFDRSGHDSRDQTRDSYWHPILEYRWEWDDGSSDTFTTVHTGTDHIYRRSSTGHIAGSQTADADADPGLIGEPNVFLPLIRARNSVGWSCYAFGGWWITIYGQAYLRSFPRDDALGAGSPRSWPPSTSVQSGPRSGPTAIT